MWLIVGWLKYCFLLSGHGGGSRDGAASVHDNDAVSEFILSCRPLAVKEEARVEHERRERKAHAMAQALRLDASWE